MGPEAVAEEWRAPARLGVAVHGSVCWSTEGVRYVCLMTRFSEKSSLHTGLMLEYTCQRLRADGFLPEKSTVKFWSDGAPHYRSAGTLSIVGFYIPVIYKLCTQIAYGIEYHGMGAVDAYFGRISRRARTVAYKEQIKTVQEL